MLVRLRPHRVRRTYLGGERLDALYGVSPPGPPRFPEAWVASVTDTYEQTGEGLSAVEDGRYLKDVLAEDPEAWLGEKGAGDAVRLPFLLKLLDSAERLVIQAHPTRAFAKQYMHSDYGKAECWYVLESGRDAYVYLGFKKGVTRAAWEALFHSQDIAGMLDCLHKLPVRAGDMLFVDGGVPHAIGPGCFLAELQEPTDLMVVTERRTPSGVVLPEQRIHGGLGLEKMFDLFDYTGYNEEEISRKYRITPRKINEHVTERIYPGVTDCFRMSSLDVRGACSYETEGYAVLLVLSGTGTVADENGEYPVGAGAQLFVGAATRRLKLRGTISMLVCRPAR